MSCVLRIGGTEVDVDALIASCGLVPYRVDRKGSPQRLRSRGLHERSSIHVDVSSADFSDLPTQVATRYAFLDAHEHLIRTAATFPGSRPRSSTSRSRSATLLSTQNSCRQISCCVPARSV